MTAGLTVEAAHPRIVESSFVSNETKSTLVGTIGLQRLHQRTTKGHLNGCYVELESFGAREYLCDLSESEPEVRAYLAVTLGVTNTYRLMLVEE